MAANSVDKFSLGDAPSLTGGQKLFLASARMQAGAYKAAMRYQIEMLTFLKHRLEQDLKFVDDVVDSDAFSDTFDVVSDFVQTAAAEYALEAGNIATIGSNLSDETARRMRKQAGEIVENRATKTVM